MLRIGDLVEHIYVKNSIGVILKAPLFNNFYKIKWFQKHVHISEMMHLTGIRKIQGGL